MNANKVSLGTVADLEESGLNFVQLDTLQYYVVSWSTSHPESYTHSMVLSMGLLPVHSGGGGV